ncbi:MAG: hypothetical protein ACM3Z4_11490 [Hyphomicrobiales bacterium]
MPQAYGGLFLQTAAFFAANGPFDRSIESSLTELLQPQLTSKRSRHRLATLELRFMPGEVGKME